MQEKQSNRSVPGPEYMVEESKLLNQDPVDFGESLWTCIAWRFSDGTQQAFLLANSGRSWSITTFKLSNN
ncbi:hypothetical protein TNCV_3660721 [Trichonephila clavipes]|nr:hypothetical protein TNCV_3660721 [Trichonephila clavipes]